MYQKAFGKPSGKNGILFMLHLRCSRSKRVNSYDYEVHSHGTINFSRLIIRDTRLNTAQIKAAQRLFGS